MDGGVPGSEHPQWSRFELVITGPAESAAALQEAAAGPAGIPWHYPDLAVLEEEQRARLVDPPDGSRGLDMAEARVLARLLREAVETHQGQVLNASLRGRACPFSLYALVPVPREILERGPDDPASREWLHAHWGTERSLRQVRLRPEPPSRRLRRAARLRYEFWALGAAPQAALTGLRTRWPDLDFELQHCAVSV